MISVSTSSAQTASGSRFGVDSFAFSLGERLRIDDYMSLRRKLRQSTGVKSKHERIFKKVLLHHDVPVLYEPITLYLKTDHCGQGSAAQRISYIPDFMLPFNYIDGRTLVIEPHSDKFLNIAYLSTLNGIRDKYGLYIVVNSTMNTGITQKREELEIIATYWSEFVDELWFPNTYEHAKAIDARVTDLLRRSELRPESSLKRIAELADEVYRENPAMPYWRSTNSATV